MAFILRADQKVNVSINPTDAYGNPATVDGVPAWNSSDVTKLTVAPAPDGLSAVVEAVGPAGTGIQVNVSADADLGAGVRTITGLLEVDVVGGEAAIFNITTGTPEAKE